MRNYINYLKLIFNFFLLTILSEVLTEYNDLFINGQNLRFCHLILLVFIFY